MNFELLTVTDMTRGAVSGLVSVPVMQVASIGVGRYAGSGLVVTTAGGIITTKETYSELVEMFQSLTGTGE